MDSIPVFVGLDYHQDAIQVCVLESSGRVLVNRAVRNDAGSVNRLVRRHGRPVRIAAEACCGAANLAQQLRSEYDLPIDLGHPGYVARMKGSPDKSDLSDAHLLADLVRVNYLPQVWLAPDYIRELRRLSRHRQQLVARQRDVKLRIRALLRENRQKCTTARPWTIQWLTWLREVAELCPNDRWIVEDHLQELVTLRERTKAVEKRILVVTADDPVIQHLLSLDCVGLVTALTLRAEIGEFDRFRSGKQLARFCAVTPRNASSGTRQADAGLIRAGNPQLRVVLMELAHRLLHRLQGHWSQLGYALIRRGKPKNVAIAAVANRWVRWLYHEMHTLRNGPSASAQAQQKGAAPCRSAITSP
jgi:transposase